MADFIRHAELVSASIPETSAAVGKWALKRVQGDELVEMLSYTVPSVLGERMSFGNSATATQNLATSVNIGNIRR